METNEIETTPTFTCAHCGEPVSGRGTPNADGGRYCKTKRACIRARDRAAYRRRLGETPIEDRPCSHCGAELPTRNRLPSDSPLGRWCRDKAACRRARADAPAAAARLKELYVVLTAQHARLFAAEVIPECPRCGAEGQRVGFRHRDPDDREVWCRELGKETAQPLPMFPPDGVSPCDCPACVKWRGQHATVVPSGPEAGPAVT
jgi:hypothetical protein